ncbi:MAG: hypothetical protein EBZ51_11515 [Synechococcaceae bacterium WB9_2_112]|nr:hypothetical protein [Synechococcaceae bacterium WB9_2_112]
MGFKISEASSYRWPVAGEVAGVRFSFKADFAFLPQERIDYLTVASARRQALLERGEDDADLQGVTARAIAAEVLVGWDDVTDDNDEPVPFTAAAADRFLQIQGVAAAVVQAWGESLQGAKRGNSKAPRGIG